MHARNLADAEPFVTVDGSAIQELAGQVSLPAVNQSLAQATIPVGGATTVDTVLTESLPPAGAPAQPEGPSTVSGRS
jgi:hypothetical protein